MITVCFSTILFFPECHFWFFERLFSEADAAPRKLRYAKKVIEPSYWIKKMQRGRWGFYERRLAILFTITLDPEIKT